MNSQEPQMIAKGGRTLKETVWPRLTKTQAWFSTGVGQTGWRTFPEVSLSLPAELPVLWAAASKFKFVVRSAAAGRVLCPGNHWLP